MTSWWYTLIWDCFHSYPDVKVFYGEHTERERIGCINLIYWSVRYFMMNASKKIKYVPSKSLINNKVLTCWCSPEHVNTLIDLNSYMLQIVWPTPLINLRHVMLHSFRSLKVSIVVGKWQETGNSEVVPASQHVF